jgi:large repetitive protein
VFEPVDPIDFTYDFCTGDGASPETVTCTLPFDFPAFLGTNLGIEVSIDATVPDGTVLSNTVSISSDVDDGNPGNNTSTADVTVRAVANLRVQKLMAELDNHGDIVRVVPYPDGLEMPAGYAATFLLVVVNDGPSAAAGVQVIDGFEPDSSHFETAACTFLNGEVVCPYTNAATGDLLLPGDANAFAPQLFFITKGDTPEGTYFNRVRVSTTTTETDLTDNDDQRQVDIGDPIADLIIEKSSATAPLVAGETFTYNIAVSAGRIELPSPTNPTGTIRLSSDAQDAVVTDTLPDGLVPASALSSQGNCTVSGQVVRCELGTVASTVSVDQPTPPAVVTITGTVAPDADPNDGANFSNTAVATTATALIGGATEVAATATTPLTRRADLDVTKSVDTDTVAAGGGRLHADRHQPRPLRRDQRRPHRPAPATVLARRRRIERGVRDDARQRRVHSRHAPRRRDPHLDDRRHRSPERRARGGDEHGERCLRRR